MAWAPADELGEKDPLLPKAKKKLSGNSYGLALKAKGDVSDVVTQDWLDALRVYKNNVHFDVARGRRAGPDLNPADPKFDWATKKQMGLLAAVAAPPNVPPFTYLNLPGTWGWWDNGFGWDVALRLDRRKFDIGGAQYNTNAFMIGNDPSHSYLDMLRDGRAEGLRLLLPNRHQRKVLGGYSGGSGVVVEILRAWPADRRHEIAAVVQFGDPNRPPGRTLLGNDPGGHGISEDFPPDWILDRYYSFTIKGDMYPNAVGLLPVFYDILTRMEASGEFAMYLFGLMADQLGNLSPLGMLSLGVGGDSGIPGFGQLAGLLPLLTGGVTGGTAAPKINLIAMLFNIPAIIQSLMALLDFMISGAHGKYLDPAHAEFDGLTAVDKAAQILNAL